MKMVVEDILKAWEKISQNLIIFISLYYPTLFFYYVFGDKFNHTYLDYPIKFLEANIDLFLFLTFTTFALMTIFQTFRKIFNLKINNTFLALEESGRKLSYVPIVLAIMVIPIGWLNVTWRYYIYYFLGVLSIIILGMIIRSFLNKRDEFKK